jgi:hypothetical protein
VFSVQLDVAQPRDEQLVSDVCGGRSSCPSVTIGYDAHPARQQHAFLTNEASADVDDGDPAHLQPAFSTNEASADVGDGHTARQQPAFSTNEASADLDDGHPARHETAFSTNEASGYEDGHGNPARSQSAFFTIEANAAQFPDLDAEFMGRQLNVGLSEPERTPCDEWIDPPTTHYCDSLTDDVKQPLPPPIQNLAIEPIAPIPRPLDLPEISKTAHAVVLDEGHTTMEIAARDPGV